MVNLRIKFLFFLVGLIFFTGNTLFGDIVQHKDTVFQDSIFDLSVQQPEAAMIAAQRVLIIPNSTFSNKQKEAFFRKLASEFERTNHYKEAYRCLKIADSLSFVSEGKKKIVSKSKSRNRQVILFYSFLFVFIIFVLYIAVYLYLKNRQLFKIKTENKQLNREFNALKADLEKEIKEETRELQQKLDEVKKQEAELKTTLQKIERTGYLRNAFIANLGFDVRTSLNGIIGFANMLETELAVKENRDLFIFASSIVKSGSRVMRLLNNVIDLSAVEARSMEIKNEPSSVEQVMTRVYNKFIEQAKDKNLIFKMKVEDELPPVLADEKALEKILDQITDNAIRYTSAGFVTLSASYIPEKEMNLIEIKDNGPGMDKSVKQSIMGRGDSSVTGKINYSNGTGIGLKLVRKLLNLIHGKMELITKQGEGTIVQIYLPCSEQVASVAQKEPVQTVEYEPVEFMEKLDLFVLEDDRMNRLILEKMLKKLGDVELAVDGNDCLNKVRTAAENNHYFQVMIFDINLPDEWDGVQLMKKIRADYPAYRNIPFIAQTAYAMEGDKERFITEGFDSYISKPIDRNELYTVIHQQLDRFYRKK